MDGQTVGLHAAAADVQHLYDRPQYRNVYYLCGQRRIRDHSQHAQCGSGTDTGAHERTTAALVLGTCGCAVDDISQCIRNLDILIAFGLLTFHNDSSFKCARRRCKMR